MKSSMLVLVAALLASQTASAGAYIECKGKWISLIGHYTINPEDRREGIFDVTVAYGPEELPTFKRTDIEMLDTEGLASEKMISRKENYDVKGERGEHAFQINLPKSFFSLGIAKRWRTELLLTSGLHSYGETVVCNADLDYEIEGIQL